MLHLAREHKLVEKTKNERRTPETMRNVSLLAAVFFRSHKFEPANECAPNKTELVSENTNKNILAAVKSWCSESIFFFKLKFNA